VAREYYLLLECLEGKNKKVNEGGAWRVKKWGCLNAGNSLGEKERNTKLVPQKGGPLTKSANEIEQGEVKKKKKRVGAFRGNPETEGNWGT